MAIKDFHCDDPEWLPLESILPLEECAAFMYMGWFEVDGQRLHHYKHQMSRRYLFVTDALKTYRYVGGDAYVPQARKVAIRYALEDGRWTQQDAEGMLAYHETDNGETSR